MTGVLYSFKGRTAHAAGAPFAGRSALDAAELMNVGCNYLREHIIPCLLYTSATSYRITTRRPSTLSV